MVLIYPPKGTEVLAQVIYGHPASGDETTFLSEAKELAKIGVRSCLLRFEFEKKESDPANLTDPQREILFRKNCLSKVQEASILLGDCAPQIYVGRNFGAFVGGMAASLQNKISRYILIAGLPDLTNFFVSSGHPVAVKARVGVSKDQLQEYLDQTRPWNPTRLLSATPAAKEREFFFQFGDRDPWIPEEIADEFIRAARGPKTVRFYDDDHDLQSKEARFDRMLFVQASGKPVVGAVVFQPNEA